MLSNGRLLSLLLALLCVEASVALSGEDGRRGASRSGTLMRTEGVEAAQSATKATAAAGEQLSNHARLQHEQAEQHEEQEEKDDEGEEAELEQEDVDDDDDETEAAEQEDEASLLEESEDEDEGEDEDEDEGEGEGEEMDAELLMQLYEDDLDDSQEDSQEEEGLGLGSNDTELVELTEEQEAEEASRWINMYVGCWADTSKRDLPVYKGHQGLRRCRQKCKGYTFFGRQWTNECWCGNTYGKWGKGNKCNCYGKNKGAWVNCLYQMVLPTTTTLSEAQKELRDPKLSCKTKHKNCKCAHRRRRRAFDHEDRSTGRRRCTAANRKTCERAGDRCFKQVHKKKKAKR